MGDAGPIRRYTVAEYLAQEAAAEYRSEYFEGEIFAMSSGSGNLALIGNNAGSELCSILASRGCRVFNSDIKIRIENSSAYYYADVSVICERPIYEDPKNTIVRNPLVIIEVLSESTESFDRRKKFHRYKQISSFKEYVLIAQDEPQIDVFFKEEDKIWHLRSFAGLDAVMELRSLGIKVKLAEIYHLVEFVA
jgi:Uma2 family endonuclease